MVADGRQAGAAGALRKDGGVSDWVVVMRFVVPADGAAAFGVEAADVARLLASLPGCVGVDVGQASDDATLWSLTSRWESVGQYRRALGDFEVKTRAVPFLSRAIDEPTAYEVLFGVDAAGERTASGDLAGDAGTVERAR
jgi:quinol monooxygenase YgiN